GRPSSAAIVNAGAGRLRSVAYAELMPYAKSPSNERPHAVPTRCVAPSDARHTAGAPKLGSNKITLGCVDAKLDAPLAHVDGMPFGSERYDDQLGVGAAGPAQISVVWLPVRPVPLRTAPTSGDGTVPRNSPMPPRMEPVGRPAEFQMRYVNPKR